MFKKSYAMQMSYEITDAEKKQAEKALLRFNYTSKLLKKASDHLNIMKTSFKDDPDMSPKEVWRTRAAIRRFRDKSVDNFNEFKAAAFKCVSAMQLFSSDTQTIKLMKSFINSVDELEMVVNKFVELFDDLKSKDFPKEIVSSMEAIQKECENIEEIIDERVKHHIQTNILASNWVDAVGNELQLKIEHKAPLVVELFNQRQDNLNEILKNKVSDTQQQ